MKVSECKECEGCQLRNLFPNRNLVPPILGPSLRLEIAEAAGENEEIEGIPLVGKSGQLIDRLWAKAGVQRTEISIANTLSCRPPNNAYPTDDVARAYCSEKEGKEIVSHCYEHHLKPLLQSRDWDRIDAIGNHALEVLTGESGIMKWRGSPLPLKGETKTRVMPILHPSYLLKDQSYIPSTISDFQKGIQTPPEFYITEPTMEEVQAFQFRKFAFDLETNGFTRQIICVGLCGEAHHAIIVPFRGPYIKELKRIFENAEEVITHNGIAFDMPIIMEALEMEWIQESA